MATADDLLRTFQKLPPLEQAKAAGAILKARPMATGDDVLQAFQKLPALEQVKAAGAIQMSRPLAEPLPEPPPTYVGALWLMVVGAFIILLLDAPRRVRTREGAMPTDRMRLRRAVADGG